MKPSDHQEPLTNKSPGSTEPRAATTGPAPRPRLDRTNLLEFHDAENCIRPVRTVADWLLRRREILAGMQEVMGPLPGSAKRGPLDVRVEEEVSEESYVRRLITYAAEPGGRVPAYLLVPKTALAGTARCPGALCLMGTNDVLGHKTVVGLDTGENRRIRNYGQELTRRGFVTIAPAYPLLANYQPDLGQLGYQSGTMKAIWDNIRALDVLAALPYVKSDGYAAIGHSLGGHNAIFTAVFDERIKAIVSSCGYDSFLDYYSGRMNWGSGKGWDQVRYMPRAGAYTRETMPFDFHELIAALAPRGIFICAPKHDDNFQWQSVARINAAAAPIYRLYGMVDRMRLEHPDCGHDFPLEARLAAYEFIEQLLQP